MEAPTTASASLAGPSSVSLQSPGMPSVDAAALRHRHFLVLCRQIGDAASQGQFALNNLAAGRVDLLCRVLAAACFLSHGKRKNVTCWLVLVPQRLTIEVVSALLPSQLQPNERSVAMLLQRALASPSDPGPGFVVHTGAGAESVLAHLAAGGARAIVLQEDGDSSVSEWLQHEYASSVDPAEASAPRPERTGVVTVVGDNEGFAASELELFGRLGLPRVTVGPLPLFASHCIVLAHNALDCLLPRKAAIKHAAKALPHQPQALVAAAAQVEVAHEPDEAPSEVPQAVVL